jgi:hypothetical protein
MKQHLETHFKDKSRSSGSQRSHRTSLADARRNSTSGPTTPVLPPYPGT